MRPEEWPWMKVINTLPLLLAGVVLAAAALRPPSRSREEERARGTCLRAVPACVPEVRHSGVLEPSGSDEGPEDSVAIAPKFSLDSPSVFALEREGIRYYFHRWSGVAGFVRENETIHAFCTAAQGGMLWSHLDRLKRSSGPAPRSMRLRIVNDWTLESVYVPAGKPLPPGMRVDEALDVLRLHRGLRYHWSLDERDPDRY